MTEKQVESCLLLPSYLIPSLCVATLKHQFFIIDNIGKKTMESANCNAIVNVKKEHIVITPASTSNAASTSRYRKDLEIQVQETRARRIHEDMNETEYRMNSDLVKKLEADKNLVCKLHAQTSREKEAD